MKSRTNLELENVIDPQRMYWFEENDYAVLMQGQPNREVILTRCARATWELLNKRKMTVREVVDNLTGSYTHEDIMLTLEKMVNIEILTTMNYLWGEDKKL